MKSWRRASKARGVLRAENKASRNEAIMELGPGKGGRALWSEVLRTVPLHHRTRLPSRSGSTLSLTLLGTGPRRLTA